MYSLTRSLISFLSLVTYVQCVTLFVYPGNLPDGTNQPDPANNQRYSIGQSIPVKWRTDLTSLSLGVSQILPNGSEIQYMLDYNTTDRSSYWVAEFTSRNQFQKNDMYSPDWDADAVFWFQLYNDTDVKGKNTIAISQMFNVSTSDSSSERDNESDPYADSNQGLSAGAGAGIAVGAIVGTLLLASLGFFFWRRSRKAKDAVASQQTSESHLQPQPIPQHQGVYEYSHQLPASPASNVVVKPELSSESANVHEAP
ncbi:hypothetical protein FLAG1_06810 [Fusarium langsethiae]|uniref:Crumbs protein 3 n=1 Tax=Fusarium langsethiae TaxID=179993 RepID=A0A0M9EV90_FUSLA|nr:hypothetical protein FLAG1_06810 [Fusarium langsethiae]GKU04178.1 unnamed protein product [Fusarium langsethiae]GKU16419.1 unnamed protein product [Fusarium langsethiae]